MKFRFVKLENLSGEAASIYSVIMDYNKETLFDHFISEHIISYKSELLFIISRIKSMGTITGAREHFFKHNEGKPGDGVCALYDDPDKKLRLYCIRYGSGTIILGGGGEKPKNIRKLQESEKLTRENYVLREISEAITTRIRTGEIHLSYETNDFIGNLEFDTDEE